MSDQSSGHRLGHALGSTWDRSQPEAALAHARSLPAGVTRDGMLPGNLSRGMLDSGASDLAFDEIRADGRLPAAPA